MYKNRIFLLTHWPFLQVRQFALMNLMDNRNGGLAWRINLAAIAAELGVIAGAEVGGITGVRPFLRPTLFVKGGASQYLLDAHGPRLRGLFPAAELRTIPNAGHWVHINRPRDLHLEVARFLDLRSLPDSTRQSNTKNCQLAVS